MPRRGLSSSEGDCRVAQAAGDGVVRRSASAWSRVTVLDVGSRAFTLRRDFHDSTHPRGWTWTSRHGTARRPTWFAADGPHRAGRRASVGPRILCTYPGHRPLCVRHAVRHGVAVAVVRGLVLVLGRGPRVEQDAGL